MAAAMLDSIPNIVINDIHADPGFWIGVTDSNGIYPSEEFHPSAFDSDSDSESDIENDFEYD